VIESIILENLVGLGYHVLRDLDPFASGKVFERNPKMVLEREREPTLVDYVLISAIIGWICCSPSLRFGWIR
jgi:hypothetical protein